MRWQKPPREAKVERHWIDQARGRRLLASPFPCICFSSPGHRGSINQYFNTCIHGPVPAVGADAAVLSIRLMAEKGGGIMTDILTIEGERWLVLWISDDRFTKIQPVA